MEYNLQEILLVFSTVLVLSVIIYISATSPSKEEFVELHWKFVEMNLSQEDQGVQGLPFREGDTFLIDSDSFNVVSVNNKSVIVANYPKNVNVSDFNVGFVVKSFYSEDMSFNVSMFVNETMEKNEILTLSPKQELDLRYRVNLTDEGLYNVRVAATSLDTNQQALIDFWVRYSI